MNKKLHAPVKISTLLSVVSGVLYVVTGVILITFINYNMRQQALVEAKAKMNLILDRNLAVHAYFSKILKPSLFEYTDPFRTSDHFDPSWMSSSYAVREMGEIFKGLNAEDYYYKDAVVNARNPKNEADAEEAAFLAELRTKPSLKERSGIRTIDGQPYLVVLRPGEVLEEGCLLCHSDPEKAPGDLVRQYGAVRAFHREADLGQVISAVSVRVPLAVAYADADSVSYQLSVVLAAILGFLFFVQYWIPRQLVFAPLAKLRDKALQISTHEEHLGEQIPMPIGEELGTLTGAFNAMSVHVRESRDHLETRVQERTAELKRSEDALRRERDFAEGLIETAQTIVLVLDTEGRILRFNPYMEELSGYALEEVRGRDWFSLFLPERDRESIRSLFLKAIGDIQTRGEVTTILTKDRRARHIEWYDKTLKDDEGGVIGLLAIGQDITERRQVDEKLKESLSLLQIAEEVARLGGWSIDLDQNRVLWSDVVADIHGMPAGYAPSVVEAMNFYAPEWRERITALFTDCVQNGTAYSEELQIITAPGKRIWVHTIGEAVRDEQGRIYRVKGVFQDISEHRQTKEAIQQRVLELETVNQLSLAIRSILNRDELLSTMLDEALAILNTTHGSIELYNKTTENLEKTITRGWHDQVIGPRVHSSEGIAGRVFKSGELYISREIASDPYARPASRGLIPAGWGGIFLPIRTAEQILGVLIVSVPSEHELNPNEIRLLSILSEMTGAALQRMQLHAQTVRRLEQLNCLRTIDQAITSSRDKTLTLNILLTNTVSQLKVDAADVLLLQPGSHLLELAASSGFHSLVFKSISLRDSVASFVVSGNRPYTSLKIGSPILQRHPQFENLWVDEGFDCYWCVPLSVNGDVKGVLEVYRKTAFTPDADWLDFLAALAGQAAIAIENAQLFENLQHSNLDLNIAYDATIEGWSRALDLRDRDTEGHTLRVTDLTLKLARAMRIHGHQLTAIRRGALLHDIGKMGIPDSILLKEGPLTDEEWVVMRMHPGLAHNLLAPIHYLKDALDIPYCHHEKWDGSGYPRGLAGEGIPLAARVFAVIDVWDALTNDRPYRKKWTEKKALAYIIEQRGRHFDPDVVDVFLERIAPGKGEK